MDSVVPAPRFRKSVFQERFDIDTCTFPRTDPTSISCSFSLNSTPSDTSRAISDTPHSDEVVLTRFSHVPLGRSHSTMVSARYLPSKLLAFACALLVSLSLFYDTPLLTVAGPSRFGAAAGVIKRQNIQKRNFEDGKLLSPRADTNTDVCSRWSQQSALVNGTIYIYGGHSTTQQGQQSGTWTNDFFTIDVTKTWDISSPAIKGLPQPSGPPPVSNGYLWSSYDTLYLYGGEFSDSPPTTPTDFSLWAYDIKSATWTEHKGPKTSAGKNSAPADTSVQRAAEGAGISVPELGRGWYFAGHLDGFTTPGWSNQIDRSYLKSLIEFTFPGATNDGVESLGGSKAAGSDGVWRNITEGGIQDTAQFPSRADSALVYVPGYGAKGILVNTGGGTNVSFVS